ncbi:MAG: hypothetical protein ACAH11_04445, partial [Sphingomonas sp.]
GWLMIGVIAPLWIASKGHTAGALILASIAVLFMVVVLTPVWQKPGEVAESRLPFEPDAERAPPVVQPPSWWQLALFGVILLIYLYPVVRTGGQDLSKYTYFLLWAGLFAISAWDMFQYKRGKWMPGKRDVVWMLIFCTMTAATVTATVLNPTRGLLDIVIATIFAGLLATILLAPLWKRLRPQPRAA